MCWRAAGIGRRICPGGCRGNARRGIALLDKIDLPVCAEIPDIHREDEVCEIDVAVPGQPRHESTRLMTYL